MISFLEWKNKEVSNKLDSYIIKIQDIGNKKILVKISLDENILQVDSKKEIKKIIDLSELHQLHRDLMLTTPVIEPFNNRDSRPAPGF